MIKRFPSRYNALAMNANTNPPPDPVYHNSLREMKWILALWAVFFLWVIGYTTLYGYRLDDQPLVTVAGMPSWVFWGIFLPWVLSAAISCWFALTQIQDDSLDDPVDIAADDRERADD